MNLHILNDLYGTQDNHADRSVYELEIEHFSKYCTSICAETKNLSVCI